MEGVSDTMRAAMVGLAIWGATILAVIAFCLALALQQPDVLPAQA